MRTFAIRSVLAIAACTAACAGTRTVVAPSANAHPKTTPAVTGDVHDFDYFAGAWTAKQRRLKVRGVGSNDWEEFPSSLCMTPYLGGMATVDQIDFPTKGWSGLTVRTFNLEKRQWSIYWVSSRSGDMGSPQVGGFDGNHGVFYGEDEDDGHPVTVRYEWTKLGPDRAHWEQAFSRDGVTWEVNWTAEFFRADRAATCRKG
jgi:hypothetical protein